MNRRDIIRFWNKVNIQEPSKCWPFIGGVNYNGYGNFWLDDKIVSAHRVSWMIHNHKMIQDGLLVCHTCDNKLCCNPHHLYTGSHTDNTRDYVSRSMPEYFNKGSRNPSAKLTVSDIEDIKILYATGKYSYSQIARIYNLSPTYPHSIIKGKRWV
jgi:hypothetical protein